MSFRYRDGPVTVTLTGDLAAQLRAVVERGLGGALEVIEAQAEQVASTARAEWYGDKGVKRRTGRSGDIEVVTTVDFGKALVTVSVGSTDTRLAGASEQRRAVPLVVHSPGALSRQLRSVTVDEFWATPKIRRAFFSAERVPKQWKAATKGRTFPLIWEPTEGGGSGYGYLMAPLIRKPMKLAIDRNIAAIGQAIVRGAS